MKLLVRNLNRDITEEELLHMFQPFGLIRSCQLVMDEATGQSKGFGFLDMPNEVEGEKAIAALNGKVIQGTKIRVKRRRPDLDW